MDKYTYEIRNIDCAQCAKHLETSIAKIKGFENVNYNFATMKLTFETERTDARCGTDAEDAGGNER